MTAPIALVLARAAKGVIGDRGGIPWRIPEDMRRFKALTMGKPVIMGRKTWESLPRKPLTGRANIVITRDPNYAAEGAAVAHTLDEAVAIAERENPSEIAVIGGAEIYAAALPRASIIHLTEIHADIAGDTVMPAFDPREWREAARETHEAPQGPRYTYATLVRR